MVLMVSLIGGAVLSGAWGVYKGGKAVSDNSEASQINERAQRLQAHLKDCLKKAQKESKESLERLGEKKLAIWAKPMKRFVELFQQVKNIPLEDSTGISELSKFQIDKQTLVEMREVSLKAVDFAAGGVSGMVAGGAAAFGAYSAAGAFATASTGAAISGLSGAAATNATLAFFGGGSLAAGGLGVAGGTCVLGAVVAGPALAILGTVMGAKAEKNLDNALSNLSKVQEAEAEVNVLVTACQGVTKRSDMFCQVLNTLEAIFYLQLIKLSRIIHLEGKDFKKYKKGTREELGKIVATAQAIKAILDTPLLDDKGALTKKSESVLAATNKFIGRDSLTGHKPFPQEEVD